MLNIDDFLKNASDEIMLYAEMFGYEETSETANQIKVASMRALTRLAMDCNRSYMPQESFPLIAQLVAYDVILQNENKDVFNADTNTGDQTSTENIKSVQTLQTTVTFETGINANTASANKFRTVKQLEGERYNLYWRIVQHYRKIKGFR